MATVFSLAQNQLHFLGLNVSDEWAEVLILLDINYHFVTV
jgi:hypothetical protein